MTKRYSVYLSALIYVIDLLLLNGSMLCAHLFLFGLHKITNPELLFFLLSNFSWSTVSALAKSYKLYRPLSLQSSLNKIVTTLIYQLVLVFAVTQMFSIHIISNYQLALVYTAFLFSEIACRSIIFFLLDIARKKGYNVRRVAILGDRAIGQKMAEHIGKHTEYGYQIVETITDYDLRFLSDEQLLARLTSFDLNEIYICYKQLDQEFLNTMINYADIYLIKIKLISDLSLVNRNAVLVDYDGIPAIQLTANVVTDHKIIFMKRVFDIVFSLTIMVLGLPVFITLYLVTVATSKGPAFFKQERIGKNGRPFHIYKFRSMRNGAEHLIPLLSSAGDPRITKWGKIMRQTRLDELPQFWNVIKGDMSVVGPRPERQYFIEKILERKPAYRRLLNIRPGITSIGQVSYGYAENIDEICDRVSHDIPYLKNMTFNGDISIILKTVRVMVQRKGK